VDGKVTMGDEGKFHDETWRVFNDTLQYPEVSGAVPPVDDAWAITRSTAHFLARLVVQLGRRSVLEFGAGRSSFVLAMALARRGGGSLTSVEHQLEFCRESWTRVEQIPSVDARLVQSKLRLRLSRHGLMYSYPEADGQIASRGPYDLVFIDAPPGTHGRDGPLYDVYPQLADGALVVLDDAARSGERTAIRRWLETFPGLRLAWSTTEERGTALLIHSGDKRKRFAMRAIAGTFHDCWHRNRQQRLMRRASASRV
jgi:predicted O-methyltransferase YrrM